MDIVYSSSDSYCEIAGISILSLLEHNRNVKELNLYLIDNQISAENKQKLEGMIASFGRTLTYLAHPDIEKRSATEINVGRWNISTFYRRYRSQNTISLNFFLDLIFASESRCINKHIVFTFPADVSIDRITSRTGYTVLS